MDTQEKALARTLFQNKIYKASGQEFEDIFTRIMNYSDPDFQQIKAWGDIGDGKNDGYIKSKGIYFQVFAPKDIRKSYVNVIRKLEKDFDGLFKEWSTIVVSLMELMKGKKQSCLKLPMRCSIILETNILQQ